MDFVFVEFMGWKSSSVRLFWEMMLFLEYSFLVVSGFWVKKIFWKCLDEFCNIFVLNSCLNLWWVDLLVGGIEEEEC